MSAVLPSADSASDMPWLAAPTAPEPTSFLPCCDTSPNPLPIGRLEIRSPALLAERAL